MWTFKEIDKSKVYLVQENIAKQELDTSNYPIQMYLAVLRVLESGSLSVKKLSKHANIPLRTLLEILDELERKKLIRIERPI